MLEVRNLGKLCQVLSRNGSRVPAAYFATQPNPSVGTEDSEFRTLDLVKSRDTRRAPRKRWEKKEPPPPRYKKMPVNQDWPSVWPVARTFHPASVPLPLHQGYVPPHLTPPGKFANLELMKIPNFLHLTPPAIQRHCEALKRFCTPWPENLETEEKLRQHFPLEVTSSEYLHSSPTIRDIRTRIVTFRFKVSDFGFDEHARDKFLRLVGNRYDVKTDYLTLMVDCCPMRKQNYDYAMYLLAALYHESISTETWEAEKVEADMEKYVWEGSASQKSLAEIIAKVAENAKVQKPSYLEPLTGNIVTTENISAVQPVQQYRNSTTTLHNEGETVDIVKDYGKSVRTLFNLPLPS